MQREIQITNDGSHTIAIPEMGVTYHSHHGAIGESAHVYIEAGLQPLLDLPNDQPIYILEIGFGTGLNALLSYQKAIAHKRTIHYIAIEPYPLNDEEIKRINYGKLLSMEKEFLALHNATWEEEVRVHDYFTLEKTKASLQGIQLLHNIHCIYFDAFSPTVQPELWTQAVFEKLFSQLLPGGTLVTYCSKSIIRKAMMAAGFTVTKIPGPWGKREMVRAWRDH